MTESARPVQVAVCGPGDADQAAIDLADAVGQALGRRGATVICGGLGGCMEAACRGAKAAGGTTVGIVPGYEVRSANRFVDHVVCTGMGQARNAIVVASGSAVIAVAGGAGTLSEVAMAIRLGRRVVLLGAWPQGVAAELAGMSVVGATVRVTGDADEAAEMAMGTSG